MSQFSPGRRRYHRDWRVAAAAVAAVAVVGGAAAVAPHLTGHGAAGHIRQVAFAPPVDGGSGSYNGTVSTSKQQGMPGPGATVYDYTPGNGAQPNTGLAHVGTSPLPDGTQVSIQCYWTGDPQTGANAQGSGGTDGFWDQINSASTGMPGQLNGQGDVAVVPDADINTGTTSSGAVQTVDQIVSPCDSGSGGTASPGAGSGSPGSPPAANPGSGAAGSQGTIDGVPAAGGPCTDIEVVFARGTGEKPTDYMGLGFPGGYLPKSGDQPGIGFVPALHREQSLAGKTMSFYAVNYDATDVSQLHTLQGVKDMENYMQTEAARCPNTKFVLGGYSQGAAVLDVTLGLGPVLAPVYGTVAGILAGILGSVAAPVGAGVAGAGAGFATLLATQPGLPASYAQKIVAVVSFGNPIHWANQSPTTASSQYGPEWADFCMPQDPICANGYPVGHPTDPFFTHRQYHITINGSSLTQQAADSAASHLSA